MSALSFIPIGTVEKDSTISRDVIEFNKIINSEAYGYIIHLKVQYQNTAIIDFFSLILKFLRRLRMRIKLGIILPMCGLNSQCYLHIARQVVLNRVRLAVHLLTLFFSSFCLCFSSSRARRFSAFSRCSSSFRLRSSSWLSRRRRAFSSFSSHWAFFAAANTVTHTHRERERVKIQTENQKGARWMLSWMF